MTWAALPPPRGGTLLTGLVCVFLALLLAFPGITAANGAAVELMALPIGLWCGAVVASAVRVSIPLEVPVSQVAVEVFPAKSAPAIKAEQAWRRSASPLTRTSGLAALGLVFGLLLYAPPAPWLLVTALALYAVALYFWPPLWLLVTPLALPLLDLTFWSGQFYWDAFDYLMLTTLGARWASGYRPALGPATPRRPKRWLLVLGASALISGVIGIWPLSSLSVDSFANYWSHYNALRLAKGFVWGVLLYLWLRPELSLPRIEKWRWGLALGAAATALIALREAWLFSDGASAADYRAIATFSSMHTGGGHIEAFFVFALAFAVDLCWRNSRWVSRLVGLSAVLIIFAALNTTVARGGQVGAALVVMISLFGAWRARRASGQIGYVIAAGGIGLVILVSGFLASDFLQARWARSGEDAGIRWRHWTQSVGFATADLGTWLFGLGLGSYPRAYLFAGSEPLATYSFNGDGDKRFLRLGEGGTLYMAQRLPSNTPVELNLSLDLRADANARLAVSLCEKHVFNSHRCSWQEVPASSDWQTQALSLINPQQEQVAWWARRPLHLSLLNLTSGSVISIDNLRLTDSKGRSFLRNGDFELGGAGWFFNSGNHLAWHAKNLWVHIFVEQGLVGVLVWSGLFLVAGWRLWRRLWRGDASALAWLAALGGTMPIAFIDSVLDAPRLALLLVLTLLVGASGVPPSQSVRRN